MNQKIVIVDDHVLFAQSLKAMIGSFDNFEVIKVLSNGKELVHFLQNENEFPDLVLLDVNMPIMNGVQTMEWLKEDYPRQKVLALSMEDDELSIIKMVKAGIKGYILKDIPPNKFKKAIEVVLHGDYYYSDAVSEKISRHKEQSTEELKEKELQFLKLACSEKTYKEIASEMNLSPKTIENYREKLFYKLGVKSRIGLVIYAIKNEIFFL